jgi:hypothetical protein
MLTSYEFRKRWLSEDDSESLVVFPTNAVVDIAIPVDSKAFLTTGGLPESAAPFLDFRVPDHGALQTVAEMWQLAPEYNRYRVIGFNGSGDPLSIDESFGGQIVYLNHDFDFHRVLINSSVPQLAESLLAFRHLIRETQRRNGDDAYLDGDVPQDLQQWLLSEIIRIDPAAAHPDCFWPQELENIRENAK